MSKVVKGVGRAVSSVVKGVGNVVKKVASSKLGKVLLIAATVYFGGAALMGAMGGAAAGTGVAGTLSGALSGAASGIGSAWSGLTGALSAGSLSGAASSLGSGFTGAYGAGQAAVTGASAAAGAAGAAGAGAAPMAVQTAAPTATSAVTGAKTATGLNLLGADAASTGMIGKMMASPYAAPALISGGTQLISGAMQGYGNQKIYEQQKQDQKQLAADERARYNTNVGTRLFG